MMPLTRKPNWNETKNGNHVFMKDCNYKPVGLFVNKK